MLLWRCLLNFHSLSPFFSGELCLSWESEPRQTIAPMGDSILPSPNCLGLALMGLDAGLGAGFSRGLEREAGLAPESLGPGVSQ